MKVHNIVFKSGDWVENLTALDIIIKKWEIYQHEEEKQADNVDDIDVLTELDNKQIFNLMLKDFSN
jgi:hypothetical protein